MCIINNCYQSVFSMRSYNQIFLRHPVNTLKHLNTSCLSSPIHMAVP
jgi:hypothetical protein